MTTELSQYILNGLEIEYAILSLEMKLLNYTSYKVASKQNTNLTSIMEVAVIVCFILLQDTAYSVDKMCIQMLISRINVAKVKSKSE